MELVDTAELVQRERMRLGLTQAQLADRLGVHERTVARWEDGAFKPHDVYLTRLRKMQPATEPASTPEPAHEKIAP